jgi:hypothetical protein
VFNNPNESERCGCGESFKVWYNKYAQQHCKLRISNILIGNE